MVKSRGWVWYPSGRLKSESNHRDDIIGLIKMWSDILEHKLIDEHNRIDNFGYSDDDEE